MFPCHKVQYRKIPMISTGLFWWAYSVLDGLIFGGAIYWKEILRFKMD